MNNMFIKTESSLTRGIPRTMFKKPFTHKTSFNAGVAVPLLCERVYPGTTIKMALHTITRMATPVNPIMDDIYQDFHFFFVPMRVILEKCAPFNNEWNTPSKNWDSFIAYSDWSGVSNLKLPTSNVALTIAPGSIGHYLGLPLGVISKDDSYHISMLQAGAYTLIWNTFFRDENYQTEKEVIVGDSTDLIVGGSYNSKNTYCMRPYFVNEMHDPFTSVLPSPQKGPTVGLPLGTDGLVPVVSGPLNDDASTYLRWTANGVSGVYGMTFGKANNPITYPAILPNGAATAGAPLNIGTGFSGPPTIPDGAKNGIYYNAEDLVSFTGKSFGDTLVPNNLYANFAASASLTINQLRESILLQHYLETLARSGSRYNEWLLGFFDVVSPDSRLQRPEYIVGKRIHINISEVLQTSGEAVNDTVLGTTGAVSRTTSSNNGLFTYSAVEHGFLFCISTVRHALSYSQGLHKQFTDIEALDFYNPIFNGIGEQPIYKREILLKTGDVPDPDNVGLKIKRAEYSNAGSQVVNFGEDASILGFNEPWWDVRYNINRASGLLDPVGATSLNTWTLTKAFNETDITGASVRVADDTTIDRVIRVQNEDQFIGEYLFDMEVVAKIPLRSLPGIMRI